MRLAALASVTFATAVLTTSAAQALTVNLVPDANLAANPAALLAFDRAALAWSNAFSDPITVTINAGLSSNFSNPATIGGTSPVPLFGGYTLIRDQLIADAADEPSNAIVASLPTAAQFSAMIPTGYGISSIMTLSKANAKAMGFTGLDAAYGVSDATITFNSNYAFDYDSSNGVSAGTIDFQTVAMHEIGHALGFLSSVDDVDESTSAFAIEMNPMDLFRFALADTPTDATSFTNNARSLVPGFESVISDSVNAYRMSTGVNNGDGRQASHFKDDLLTGTLIGLMDPTVNDATAYGATLADLRVFDLIGYDVIPEPTSLAIFGLAGLAMLRRPRA